MAKILLIEDEHSVRENIIDLLEAEDHEVISTENGFMGLLWAFEYGPDLIICDVMMPEINGHEVLEALRKDPATAAIPYIFLTALSDKTDIRRGMELGADDYLTKPYTRAELLGAIEVRLARQESINQKKSAAEQKLQELQSKIETLEKTIQQENQSAPPVQDHVERAIAKIEAAMSLLSTLETEEQRDCCLSILKQTCSEDLKMIKSTGYSHELLVS